MSCTQSGPASAAPRNSKCNASSFPTDKVLFDNAKKLTNYNRAGPGKQELTEYTKDTGTVLLSNHGKLVLNKGFCNNPSQPGELWAWKETPAEVHTHSGKDTVYSWIDTDEKGLQWTTNQRSQISNRTHIAKQELEAEFEAWEAEDRSNFIPECAPEAEPAAQIFGSIASPGTRVPPGSGLANSARPLSNKDDPPEPPFGFTAHMMLTFNDLPPEHRRHYTAKWMPERGYESMRFTDTVDGTHCGYDHRIDADGEHLYGHPESGSRRWNGNQWAWKTESVKGENGLERETTFTFAPKGSLGGWKYTFNHNRGRATATKPFNGDFPWKDDMSIIPPFPR